MSDLLLSASELTLRAPIPASAGRLVPLLRDVALELKRGELCGLLGRSGSGKTLLARTLLGIGKVQGARLEGSIHYHSSANSAPLSLLSAAAPSPPAGWAGYIFQDPVAALDPMRTVADQIAESIALRSPGLSRRELLDRAEHWLQRVRLADPQRCGRLYPFELSGGMAQRVCAAVALAAEPELLVADEPTSGLDWSLRRGLVELLGEQCQQLGSTLLLISHDEQVVEHLTERVLTIEGGVLVSDQDGCLPRYSRPLEKRPEGDVPEHRLRLLRARGLRRSFVASKVNEAPVEAVAGVDLDLYEGELVGLVGESGSGKTTLGKVLLNILVPDEGELCFDGYELPGLAELQLRRLRGSMQYSYQQPGAALNPAMSIAQHLQETAQLHCGVTAAEAPTAALRALADFEMESKGDSFSGELSGGEQRRASLARVLMPQPRLLVLDEPSAGLDAEVKLRLLNRLRQGQGSESCVVVISHELELVSRFANRVLVMYAGRVVEELPPSSLDPAAAAGELHPYTDQLLAASFRSIRTIEPERRPKDPGGCSFRHRCHRVAPEVPLWQRCTNEEPVLVQGIGAGHRVACHLFENAVNLESQ